MTDDTGLYEPVYKLMPDQAYDRALRLLLTDTRECLSPEFMEDGNHSWFLVGECYWKQGKYKKALIAYRQALVYWSSDTEAMFAVANCYAELGRLKLAERFYKRALIAGGSDDRISYNYGNNLFDQGKYSEAIKQYQSVLRSKSSLSTLARKNIALCKIKTCKGS